MNPTRTSHTPSGLFFDTDMGNDVDDALALLMACRSDATGEIRLLGVVSSNPNEWAVPGIQAILRYYGYPEIPVGVCSEEIGMAAGEFTKAMAEAQGLKPGQSQDAVAVFRKALAQQPNRSVRVVATGFSTNLAGLLNSGKDHKGDGIEKTGMELVREKVEFLSIMAGHYKNPSFTEFNVANNVPAFKKAIEEWPTPVYMSGFEIGERVFSRWEHLKGVLKPENPVRMGYEVFFKNLQTAEKWDRPSWDETAMLFALEPSAGYFDLSNPVAVEVGEKGETLTSASNDLAIKRRFFLFKEQLPPEKISEILETWYREPREE